MMENIITASGFRRLKMLNILFFSEKSLKKQELIESVECSLNTLNADIKLFNDTCPPEIAHVYEEDKRLFLTSAPEISFDFLQAYMITNSDLFVLSLSIFNDDKLTIPEWAEKNFISPASFYLKLKEIDTFLARSRLILHNRPLQIEGNEINIRFYFSHLFTKSHPYSGWVSEEISFDQINLFIQEFEAHMGVFFSLSSRMEYAIAICVCLTRIKQGYAAELSPIEKSTIHDIYTYYSAENIDFSALNQFLDAPMNLIERYTILNISFLCSFTDISRERVEFRIDYHQKFRRQRFTLAEDIITLLDRRIQDTHTIKLAILDYLTRFTFVKKTNLILDVDHFSKKFVPDVITLETISAKLQKYERNPDYAFIRDNKKVISAYLHDLFNVTLMNEMFTQRLHVKIISKNGFLWEEYLKGQIRQHYSEEHLIFCEELEPKEHAPQYDLIISDSPVEVASHTKVLVWHVPPTARDFKKLGEIIESRKI
ncbi:helix-turn-helix domain-containing protein [Listeria rustica]|uniref:Mga helix-turn-helix domain-containing protein n=1 Tax=Listeria rustica TaxID=2713503 RepID=A0A7W1T6P6_9LIST|nr:helix-turn-helix domain-containing protein [Listeria rustica]MBA3926454.1 hypothetical protein [Listeria rustica]